MMRYSDEQIAQVEKTLYQLQCQEAALHLQKMLEGRGDILPVYQQLADLVYDDLLVNSLREMEKSLAGVEQRRIILLCRRIWHEQMRFEANFNAAVTEAKCWLKNPVKIAEKEFVFGSLRDLMMNDDDQQFRHKFFEAFHQQFEQYLNKPIKKVVCALQENARYLGYSSYLEYFLEKEELPKELFSEGLDQVLNEFVPKAVEIYTRLSDFYGLEPVPENYFYLYRLHQRRNSRVITAAQSWELLLQALQGLGLDWRELQNQIVFRQVSGVAIVCAAINPPQQVEIIQTPFDGLEYTKNLFHEMGHALYYTQRLAVDSSLDVDSQLYCEAMAFLNECIMTKLLAERSEFSEILQREEELHYLNMWVLLIYVDWVMKIFSGDVDDFYTLYKESAQKYWPFGSIAFPAINPAALINPENELVYLMGKTIGLTLGNTILETKISPVLQEQIVKTLYLPGAKEPLMQKLQIAGVEKVRLASLWVNKL